MESTTRPTREKGRCQTALMPEEHRGERAPLVADAEDGLAKYHRLWAGGPAPTAGNDQAGKREDLQLRNHWYHGGLNE